MTRWFNTAGPCQADIHYMLPALERLPSVERLILQRGYFVIHAPRQTGKTTAMLALAQQLTEQGKYAAVTVSAETGAPFANNVGEAENAILEYWRWIFQATLPEDLRPPEETQAPPGRRIVSFLQSWAAKCPLPIVLFIDEIDALEDDVLISVLRQLRAGYPRRPRNFPQSLALIGLRDVRDYKVASGSSPRLGTASLFNIKIESLTLRNFTHSEVKSLYKQHTVDTGQVFTDEAVQLAYDLTQGQPWLVNALARQMVEELAPDPSAELTVEHVKQAKEILILRQDTHLDSLAERLREPRVRAIIEPMLAGQELGNVSNEDIQFLIDLGLCVMSPAQGLTIANPIYREVLPRVLAFTPMAALPQITPTWLNADGKLSLDNLLQSFLSF
ncbi:ATP-binding protein [cf. Phormidesmis sp. LEGE 11477]|uniref:ATP-binding protein n=1 Tax=cf. Phormidesmis sp. LEGE 11477 TaxID=1828680 RepID=UPI00351D2782